MSSSHEIPLFDVLTNRSSPYSGFGEILQNSAQLENELHEAAATARHQVQDTFDTKLRTSQETPKEELDAIVRTMWNTGWDPEVGNLNLFTRDFGLIMIEAVLHLVGGKLIFRSARNANHCSVYWDTAAIEAFPFHKAAKCLLNQDGESMAYFVDSLADRVRDLNN
jgi:hypothetical protein